MKIPSPQEVQQTRDVQNHLVVESVVANIVHAMNNHDMSPAISVPFAVQDTVRRRFADAGWVISFHDDQRDGPRVTLTPRS